MEAISPDVKVTIKAFNEANRAVLRTMAARTRARKVYELAEKRAREAARHMALLVSSIAP